MAKGALATLPLDVAIAVDRSQAQWMRARLEAFGGSVDVDSPRES